MFSREQLLETAKASPSAVAIHDKQAWLNLFSEDSEVHDPVGSRGHAGAQALERFYDTFIAPNQIRFDVAHDIVCGQTVVRDLTIITHMGGAALKVNVPLYIRYEIVADHSQSPRVRRLYAHWELLPMITRQVFNQGMSTGLGALVKLSANMLRHQGLSGALGFSRAFAGVGRRAKRQVETCLQALNRGDSAALQACFTPTASLCLAEADVSFSDLSESLHSLRWHKMIAGGQQVVVTLLQNEQRMLALFDFAESSAHISALKVYRDTA